MSEIRLVLPYPPTVNHMYRPNGRGGKVRTDAYEAFLTEVGMRANLAMGGNLPMTGNLKVQIDFYRPSKRGDIDNPIKPTCDSLNKIVYVDDKQIVELHAYRHDDAKDPRVHVYVGSCK